MVNGCDKKTARYTPLVVTARFVRSQGIIFVFVGNTKSETRRSVKSRLVPLQLSLSVCRRSAGHAVLSESSSAVAAGALSLVSLKNDDELQGLVSPLLSVHRRRRLVDTGRVRGLGVTAGNAPGVAAARGSTNGNGRLQGAEEPLPSAGSTLHA